MAIAIGNTTSASQSARVRIDGPGETANSSATVCGKDVPAAPVAHTDAVAASAKHSAEIAAGRAVRATTSDASIAPIARPATKVATVAAKA